MVTKPKELLSDKSEETVEESSTEYVTKSELTEAITETLKSFFGGELPEGSDVGSSVEGGTSADAVGVFSIRDFETAVENAVSKISKSLIGKTPPEEEAKVEEDKGKKIEREAKPKAIDVGSVVTKVKEYLWGTE